MNNYDKYKDVGDFEFVGIDTKNFVDETFASQSFFRDALGRFKKNKGAIFGLFCIVIILFFFALPQKQYPTAEHMWTDILSHLTFTHNYSYLSSLFRKVTSGTLSDYYRNSRLETARLLILEDQLNISQIADLLHYSSIYTFSRAFKDQYGLSPEQYRKKVNAAERY